MVELCRLPKMKEAQELGMEIDKGYSGNLQALEDDHRMRRYHLQSFWTSCAAHTFNLECKGRRKTLPHVSQTQIKPASDLNMRTNREHNQHPAHTAIGGELDTAAAFTLMDSINCL